MSSLPKEIVLVTGANKNIGFEIVRALLLSTKPYHVYLGSRDLARGEQAVAQLKTECPSTANSVSPIKLDVSSDTDIHSAFTKIQTEHGRLHVLINNAAINADIPHLKGEISLRESFLNSYDTNVASVAVITSTFLPLLLGSSDPRILFISGLGTFSSCAKGDMPLPPALPLGWPKGLTFETVAYRCTKTALNMLMLDYFWKLKNDQVKIWSVGPGFLETDLGGAREFARSQGAGHPGEGGEFVRTVVEGDRDEDVGKYVVKGGIQEW
ncbi:hypothetical protein QBC44DRAFT_335512 [Cladorrhinum sp. PSN332]|nr:hypothetical protein QBC44DRAFT_335512 [Cladorrhinum sp. PSN332]